MIRLGEPGVKAGIILTIGMKGYLRELEGAAGGVPITVTSADRSPESQASAMLKKLSAKGEQELYKVYRSSSGLITKLLKAPRTAQAWAAIIRSDGMRISRHLYGGAVDLRTRDLSAGQLDTLKRAIAQTGGRAYPEYDHLHVDLPAKYAGASALESAAKGAAKSATRGIVIVTGVGLVGILLLGVWRWRSRRGSFPASVGAAREAA